LSKRFTRRQTSSLKRLNSKEGKSKREGDDKMVDATSCSSLSLVMKTNKSPGTSKSTKRRRGGNKIFDDLHERKDRQPESREWVHI
jgi:flagellar capping protein FliD